MSSTRAHLSCAFTDALATQAEAEEAVAEAEEAEAEAESPASQTPLVPEHFPEALRSALATLICHLCGWIERHTRGNPAK